MRQFLSRYGVLALLILGATVYYGWPQKQTWSVFQVSLIDGEGSWLADGFESEGECDSYVRLLLQSEAVQESGSGFQCAYDCKFLSSRPTLSYCSERGRTHEPA